MTTNDLAREIAVEFAHPETYNAATLLLREGFPPCAVQWVMSCAASGCGSPMQFACDALGLRDRWELSHA